MYKFLWQKPKDITPTIPCKSFSQGNCNNTHNPCIFIKTIFRNGKNELISETSSRIISHCRYRIIKGIGHPTKGV